MAPGSCEYMVAGQEISEKPVKSREIAITDVKPFRDVFMKASLRPLPIYLFSFSSISNF
jgi:hypothetical protein